MRNKMILKYENLLKELEQYPNLKKAVEHFYDTDGKAEYEGCLPNLIVWIRCQLKDVDMTEFFTEMSEETKEDFWSWGHNSRWGNTFYAFLCEHFNYCVAVCMNMAEEYGDFDVEKHMIETMEKKNALEEK